MSRPSSRLHSLELGLRKPRKSRAKARALTVMRLEGKGVSAAQRHVPARLPSELEDQIAIVRGRAVGKPSRGLLQLEERLLRVSDDTQPAATIQRHEHAAPPPELNTPAPEARVTQAQALNAPAAMPADVYSGHFTVESFDDSPAAPPVWNAPAVDAVRVAPAVSKTEPQAPTDSAPWINAPAQAQNRARMLSAEQKAVADDFQRDLAAMLGTEAQPASVQAPEDKQWNETLRNVGDAPAAGTATTTASTAVVPGASPAPLSNAHDIFNQMGMAMNYANSFDFGAVDLSAKFDRFDDELAREAKAPSVAPPPPPIPVRALELDDFDLVADLAEMSGAQSAPTPNANSPAVCAPDDQPAAQKEPVPATTPTLEATKNEQAVAPAP